MPRTVPEVASELAATESAMVELARQHDRVHQDYARLQARSEALGVELVALQTETEGAPAVGAGAR